MTALTYNRDMDPSPLSPVQGVQLFLEHRELLVDAGEASKDALADARRDLSRFAAWLEQPASLPCAAFPLGGQGRQTIRDCRADDLGRWLLVNQQWKSPSTKKRVFNEVLACFRWLQEEGHGPSPFRRPRGLKFKTRSRRAATEAEYVALMRGGSRPLKRALFFLRNTDVRTCEMREATWADLDWQAGVIRLWQHKTARATGEPRIVGLTPRVLHFLKILFRKLAAGAGGHIFLNADGTPWKKCAFAIHLRRTCKRLGLDRDGCAKLSGYCFRHMGVTEGIEAGIDEQKMAAHVGHADTTMLKQYNKARSRPKYIREVAIEIEQARRQKRKSGRPAPVKRRPDWEQGELF